MFAYGISFVQCLHMVNHFFNIGYIVCTLCMVYNVEIVQYLPFVYRTVHMEYGIPFIHIYCTWHFHCTLYIVYTSVLDHHNFDKDKYPRGRIDIHRSGAGF